MATNNISPKKGKVVDIPTAPTIGTATAGAESATVAFTAATIGGPVITYTALSSPGSITATGSSSPITVTGLTVGTAYTFSVRGNNATGSSEYSAASNSATPLPSPLAYESIATVNGSGGSGSITFSSIPQTYKHLQIRFNLHSSYSGGGPEQTRFYFNGDTTQTNYRYHTIEGNGSTRSSYTDNLSTFYNLSPTVGDSSNTPSAGIIDILDYTNTNKVKTLKLFGGFDRNGVGVVQRTSLMWINGTSAINAIRFDVNTNWTSHTKISLYGIKG